MKKIIFLGILAGIANLIVSIVLMQIYSFILPSTATEYTNSAIFRPWNDPLMSLYFLYPFILGIVLSWIWERTKKLVEGENALERGCKFGLSYYVVAGLPGMFITYSSFQVSLLLVFSWLITGFIEAIVSGWLYAKKNP